MDIPTGSTPPTIQDLIAVLTSGILAALVAWARSILDGHQRTMIARIAVVVAGGLIGMAAGAIALSFNVAPLVAVACGSLLGAAGEYLFLAVARIGIMAADDPLAMVERVTGRTVTPPPERQDTETETPEPGQ
jgi:hypothetical protein